VLKYAEGVDSKTVAARLGCAEATVGKWRGFKGWDALDHG
jgi:uncharacterized protein YjcR